MIHEIQSPLVHTPAQATGTYGSSLAAERHNMVFLTGFTERVCEASPQDSAVHVLVQFFRYELGQRPPVGLVGPLLLEGQQVLLHHLVKRSLFRLPA